MDPNNSVIKRLWCPITQHLKNACRSQTASFLRGMVVGKSQYTPHSDHIKRKSGFKHAQNVRNHVILHIHKVSSARSPIWFTLHLKHSIVANDSDLNIFIQWFASEQSDLGIRRPLMTEGTLGVTWPILCTIFIKKNNKRKARQDLTWEKRT